jgi:hypothetical protein
MLRTQNTVQHLARTAISGSTTTETIIQNYYDTNRRVTVFNSYQMHYGRDSIIRIPAEPVDSAARLNDYFTVRYALSEVHDSDYYARIQDSLWQNRILWRKLDVKITRPTQTVSTTTTTIATAKQKRFGYYAGLRLSVDSLNFRNDRNMNLMDIAPGGGFRFKDVSVGMDYGVKSRWKSLNLRYDF